MKSARLLAFTLSSGIPVLAQVTTAVPCKPQAGATPCQSAPMHRCPCGPNKRKEAEPPKKPEVKPDELGKKQEEEKVEKEWEAFKMALGPSGKRLSDLKTTMEKFNDKGCTTEAKKLRDAIETAFQAKRFSSSRMLGWAVELESQALRIQHPCANYWWPKEYHDLQLAMDQQKLEEDLETEGQQRDAADLNLADYWAQSIKLRQDAKGRGMQGDDIKRVLPRPGDIAAWDPDKGSLQLQKKKQKLDARVDEKKLWEDQLNLKLAFFVATRFSHNSDQGLTKPEDPNQPASKGIFERSGSSLGMEAEQGFKLNQYGVPIWQSFGSLYLDTRDPSALKGTQGLSGESGVRWLVGATSHTVLTAFASAGLSTLPEETLSTKGVHTRVNANNFAERFRLGLHWRQLGAQPWTNSFTEMAIESDGLYVNRRHLTLRGRVYYGAIFIEAGLSRSLSRGPEAVDNFYLTAGVPLPLDKLSALFGVGKKE